MSKFSSHTVCTKPYFFGGANLEPRDLGTTYWSVPSYVTLGKSHNLFVVISFPPWQTADHFLSTIWCPCEN